jgi:hypothetical protein
MQVSRMPHRVAPATSQRPRAPFVFDERRRLAFDHRLATVSPVGSDQRRRQLEPDNLAANDGRRVHDISVCGGSH